MSHLLTIVLCVAACIDVSITSHRRPPFKTPAGILLLEDPMDGIKEGISFFICSSCGGWHSLTRSITLAVNRPIQYEPLSPLSSPVPSRSHVWAVDTHLSPSLPLPPSPNQPPLLHTADRKGYHRRESTYSPTGNFPFLLREGGRGNL